MSTEIELKFEVTDYAVADFIAQLFTYTRLEQQQFYLTNTYYDTAVHSLRDNHCGLRIRGVKPLHGDARYELTLKRAADPSLAGLHQRLEFNADVSSDKLDLSALPVSAFPADLDPVQLQTALKPLFVTHFQRQIWLIAFKSSQIEVAFDRGEIRDEHHTLKLQEVELELKKGSLATLLDFISAFKLTGLRLSAQSKAARGYALEQLAHKADAARPFGTANFSVKQADSAQAAWQNLLNTWQQAEDDLCQTGHDGAPLVSLLADVSLLIDWILAHFYGQITAAPLLTLRTQSILLQQLLAHDLGGISLRYSQCSTKIKLSIMQLLVSQDV